jgi:hypothetical protein
VSLSNEKLVRQTVMEISRRVVDECEKGLGRISEYVEERQRKRRKTKEEGGNREFNRREELSEIEKEGIRALRWIWEQEKELAARCCES